MVLGSRAFGRWLGHESRVFLNITALIKETLESSLLRTVWGHHIVELYAKNLANLSVSVSPILKSTYPHKYLRSISIPSSYHLLLIIYHLCIILPWTSWMCSHILILFAVHSFLPFPCWYCLKLLFWVLINTLIYFYLFLYFLDSKNYSN